MFTTLVGSPPILTVPVTPFLILPISVSCIRPVLIVPSEVIVAIFTTFVGSPPTLTVPDSVLRN
jgi:hypothetical protein